MAKFTDTELSRILSAHTGGDLIRFGMSDDLALPRVCLFQAAGGYMKNKTSLWGELSYGIPISVVRRFDLFQGIASRIGVFDQQYDPQWTVTELLEFLKDQELI